MILAQLLFVAATVGVLRLLRLPGPRRLNDPPLYRRVLLLTWSLVALLLLSWIIPALGPLAFQWDAAGKMLGFTILLIGPVAIVPSRPLPIVTGLLVFAICWLGFADLVYARHFGNLLPITAVFGAGQTWAIRESIATLVRWRDLWLLVPAAASILLALAAPRLPDRPSRRTRILLTGVALLLVTPGLVMTAHNLDHWRARKVLSHPRMLRNLGLFGTHVVDAARLMREAWQEQDPSPEQIASVERYLADRPATPTDDPWFGVARGASVLVVQVESLQRFVIGLEVGGQEVTPYLNRWSTDGAFYQAIIDQTGEANTADAEYSVLNSQHPMRHGAAVFRRPDNDFVAWPARLRDAGWNTFSAHPWERGFWNRAVVHPHYGFSRSLFREELGAERDRVGWGSSDREFYARITAPLLALERPFVTYLITLMAHHPYTFFPAERRRLNLGVLEPTMLGAYLQIMHEVDQSLGAFLDGLRDAGALDNTIVVVFGDHDARLQMSPEAIAAATDVLGWSADRLAQLGSRDPRLDFIPLFVRLPGGELRGDITTVGGHLDIGPTILHLLGQPTPAAFLGQPLLPDRPGFAARIDGVALAQDRLWLTGGRNVLAGGLCLSWPAQTPLQLEACSPLAVRAAEQIQASWMITELDLAARVSEPAP